MIYKNLISIAAGGAIGTLFRYLLNMYTFTSGYPLGTVIENLLGSFLLGLLTGWVTNITLKEWVKVGIGVGFCGGFTTMSTLAADTSILFSHMGLTHAILYLLISLIGGLALAFLGLSLGDKWSKEKVTGEV